MPFRFWASRSLANNDPLAKNGDRSGSTALRHNREVIVLVQDGPAGTRRSLGDERIGETAGALYSVQACPGRQ
jgi:hypothetical protein